MEARLDIGDAVLFKIWEDRDTLATGRIYAFKGETVVIMFNGKFYERPISELEAG